MPGKGEPGWVLRESGRHPRPGDLSGSQTMLCIEVGFTIGHGLIHTLRMGAVCLTQPGSLDLSVSSLRQDQARGKTEGGAITLVGGGFPSTPGVHFCSRPILRGLYTHFPHASLLQTRVSPGTGQNKASSCSVNFVCPLPSFQTGIPLHHVLMVYYLPYLGIYHLFLGFE